MQCNAEDVIAYARYFMDQSASVTPKAYAVSQGWLDENGGTTPRGREFVKAFKEQQQTRSVFRVG